LLLIRLKISIATGRRENETGLLKHFFGAKCEGRMSLLVFEKFLVDLHTELDRLEFQHYDPNNTVRDRHVGVARAAVWAAENINLLMSRCRLQAHTDARAALACRTACLFSKLPTAAER